MLFNLLFFKFVPLFSIIRFIITKYYRCILIYLACCKSFCPVVKKAFIFSSSTFTLSLYILLFIVLSLLKRIFVFRTFHKSITTFINVYRIIVVSAPSNIRPDHACRISCSNAIIRYFCFYQTHCSNNTSI